MKVYPSHLLAYWEPEEQYLLDMLAMFSDTDTNWHYYRGQLDTVRRIVKMLHALEKAGD